MEKIYEIIRVKQEVTKSSQERYTVRSPEDVAEHAFDLIGEDDREVLLVMVLNTKNDVVAVHRCHVGTLNASIVHARDVYKTSIMNNGASIIVVHQHPSGNPQESQEDIQVCRRLVEAGKILDIPLLDFCILGEKTENKIKYTSLKEKGYL